MSRSEQISGLAIPRYDNPVGDGKTVRSDNTDVSIIIVSWNTKELLRECLESVYMQTRDAAFELFVVDNNSSDGSTEMVRNEFPRVILIENKVNAGFSKANNQAIRASSGRFVALLNPDTLLTEDVFSPLVKWADLNEKTGAIGPKIVCRDEVTIQYSCARRLPTLYYSFCYQSGLAKMFPGSRFFSGTAMSYWDHEDQRLVECLSGACMLIRKTAIDEIGLMDENQFMYADEVDWCKRLLAAGWEIEYYPQTKLIHYGGESSKKLNGFAVFESTKATWYYYRKHKGKIYASAYSVLICLASAAKYLRSVLLRSVKSQSIDLREVYKARMEWAIRKIFSRE